MPPFAGTRAERAAVAAYLARGLHGRQPDEPPTLSPPPDAAVEIPPLSAANDAWVLLAWGSMGMHCLTDSDPWFVILPPSNELHAQLIRRGPTPVVVTDGVVVSLCRGTGIRAARA
ncbi:MAG: hypothetical protein IPH48_15730 [bacterium]|nr:hypothetical protein [bacterium]